MNLGKINTIPYCIEARTIFNAMTIRPDGERRGLINNLVKGLKTDVLWLGKDCYYIMAAHTNDNGEAQINWKNPGTFDLILINNPAFEVGRGFTGNGINQCINTNYNPNINAINYALNDASIGIYIRNNVSEDRFDMGVDQGGGRSSIASKWSTNFTYSGINNITTINFANTDSRGFYIISRNEAAGFDGYKNKIQNLLIKISTSIPDEEFYILCLNLSGLANNFSTKQVASVFVGGGMTQTNVNNETDRLETFLDAIGAGVIP